MKSTRHCISLALLGLAFASSCVRGDPGKTAGSVHPDTFLELRTSKGIVIGSLRKLDDFPLYELTYKAKYDQTARLSPRKGTVADAFACTCFAASNGEKHRILGRNFDWKRHPALVLRTSPEGAYASLSLVDISYLGYSGDITPLNAPDRLMDAPYLPFDGMNEKGLAVGMMAVEKADSGNYGDKGTVDELMLIRLMLDKAATVEEAIAICGKYNVDFGSVPIHYLLTDAAGDSAIVEYVAGKMEAIRAKRGWQVSTNFIFTGTKSTSGLCQRYDAVNWTLGRANGVAADPFFLLQSVSQDSTIWSCVYDLHDKTLAVAIDRKWEKPYRFTMNMN